MAVTDAYATAEEYREVSKGVDAATDSVINRDLTAVSRWLEHKLGGRFFTKDAADVARIYIPIQPTKLFIDDLSASPTTVKIDENDDGDFSDETALVAADFELWPLNADKGPEPRPFNEIRLTAWGNKASWRNLRVEIVAIWGWPAIPDIIKDATVEFTRLWRMETPRATTRITELDQVIGMSRSAQSLLEDLLSGYRGVPIA